MFAKFALHEPFESANESETNAMRRRAAVSDGPRKAKRKQRNGVRRGLYAVQRDRGAQRKTDTQTPRNLMKVRKR